MAEHDEYYNTHRPFMAYLPTSSIRQLPMDKTKEKYATDNSNANLKYLRTDLLLKQYGLEAAYNYQSRKNQQRNQSAWRNSEVQRVVEHYIQATDHGYGDPMQPQPATLCQCCLDINDANKRHQYKSDNLQEKSKGLTITKTKPNNTVLKTAMNPKKVHFSDEEEQDSIISIAYPFYRTDYSGPEMTAMAKTKYNELANDRYNISATNNQLKDYGSNPHEDAIFITHPAKKSLYSKWSVDEELQHYTRNRYMAEDVVLASSQYVNSMQKLKQYTQK